MHIQPLTQALRFHLLPLALCAICGLLTGCKVGSSKHAETPAAKDPIPKHSLIKLKSSVLGQTRDVAVYVPQSYQSKPQTNFPVLYMPDGGLNEDFPHIVHTIQSLADSNKIPEMLVVGVKNIDRYHDMSTLTKTPEELERIPNPGGFDDFLTFFTTELRQYIEQNYRVKDQPTAIVGESLAGFFVVNGWLRNPQAYNAWIAVDPALWWNEQELKRSAKQHLAAHSPSSTHRLYINGAGRNGEGNLKETRLLVQELRSLGVGPDTLVFEPHLKWAHSDIFRATKEKFFETMLAGWRGPMTASPQVAR